MGEHGKFLQDFDIIMNDSKELQQVAQWLRAIQVIIQAETPLI